jgi:hypothetical protein
MFDDILAHTRQTWTDVLDGKSTLSEKAEFGAEALTVAVATAALTRFGVSRCFSEAKVFSETESALAKVDITVVGKASEAPLAVPSLATEQAAVHAAEDSVVRNDWTLTALTPKNSVYQWNHSVPGEDTLPGDSAVKAANRFFGIDRDGPYIKFMNGEAIVNGSFVRPGAKTYLKMTDEVVAPNFYADGAEAHIQLVPKRISKAPELAERTAAAQQQVDKFSQTFRLKEPLKDGFEFDQFHDTQTGFFRRIPTEPGTLVVDRANDPVLRATIQRAQERIKELQLTDPVKIATFLTDFTKEQLEPAGASLSGQSAWSTAFTVTHQAMRNRILLGDYIAAGQGLCAPRAALLKVLADEANLNSTLVVGGALRADEKDAAYVSVHAFNYFKFPNVKGAKIFDATTSDRGTPFDRAALEAGKWVPGSDAIRKLIWNKLPSRAKAFLNLPPDLSKKGLTDYYDVSV